MLLWFIRFIIIIFLIVDFTYDFAHKVKLYPDKSFVMGSVAGLFLRLYAWIALVEHWFMKT